MTNLEPGILEAALVGLEAKLTRVNEQIASVRTAMGKRRPGRPARIEAVAEAPAKPARKKRRLSAAGRKAIVDALKRRWATKKAAEAPAAKKTARRKTAPKFSELKARDQKKASKKSAKKTAAKTATAGDEVPF